MAHKLSNELFLLKTTIDRTPFTYPEKEKEGFIRRYQALEADPEARRQDIDKLIVEIGKATWPYRKAYEEMVKNYGQQKLEEFFKLHLGDELRQKYEQFVAKGLGLKDYRRTKEFEEFFTPEENLQIEEALFSARDEQVLHMRGIIESKSDEYEENLKAFQKKQVELENMIANLRQIANQSDKWSDQILDKIKVFEEGWSVVERDFDEDNLRHEIEYWQGVTGLE